MALFVFFTLASPGKVLRALRMLNAQRMLETSDVSIKEVVAQAGFRDESNFLRTFKEIHVVTPSEYRAQYIHGLATCTCFAQKQVRKM